MNNREPNQEKSAQPKTRRPYVKPAFSCEQVFEVTALACGKGAGCGSMSS